MSALAWASPAYADAPPACTHAYVGAQEDRRAGHLVHARSELLVCGSTMCPAAIVADCAEWLRDVDRATPSFVVTVVDREGHERTDAQVIIDGEPASNALDGRALATDPGPHELRVMIPGEAALGQHVVLREGERSRAIVFRYPSRPAATAPLPPARRVPTMSWTLGGVGTASLIVSGIIAGTAFWGSPSFRTLDECKPRCSLDEADKVHAKLIVSDITLGVGLVAIGTAIWLALRQRHATRP